MVFGYAIPICIFRWCFDFSLENNKRFGHLNNKAEHMYNILVTETCPQKLLPMKIHYMIGSFLYYLIIAFLFQT